MSEPVTEQDVEQLSGEAEGALPARSEASPSRPPASQPPWRAQAASDDDDLRESLAALSHLATAQMEFSDVLTRVTELAALAIPNADGVGLMLSEARHAESVIASAPFVAEVEVVQRSVDEGPCITAMTEARVVTSGSLSTDTQWPRFGPAVGALDVHSALAVPLRNADHVLGAMNVYSRQDDAFDEHAVVTGELFAAPAAIAVHNAQVLAHTQLVAARLKAALTQRAVIDQAIGVVIARTACTPDEASDALRRVAQDKDLHATASQIVDDAVHRPIVGADRPANPRDAGGVTGRPDSDRRAERRARILRGRRARD